MAARVEEGELLPCALACAPTCVPTLWRGARLPQFTATFTGDPLPGGGSPPMPRGPGLHTPVWGGWQAAWSTRTRTTGRTASRRHARAAVRGSGLAGRRCGQPARPPAALAGGCQPLQGERPRSRNSSHVTGRLPIPLFCPLLSARLLQSATFLNTGLLYTLFEHRANACRMDKLGRIERKWADFGHTPSYQNSEAMLLCILISIVKHLP